MINTQVASGEKVFNGFLEEKDRNNGNFGGLWRGAFSFNVCFWFFETYHLILISRNNAEKGTIY